MERGFGSCICLHLPIISMMQLVLSSLYNKIEHTSILLEANPINACSELHNNIENSIVLFQQSDNSSECSFLQQVINVFFFLF